MSDDAYDGVIDEETLRQVIERARSLQDGIQSFPRIRQRAYYLIELLELCQASLQWVAETHDEAELPNLQTALEVLQAVATKVRDDQGELLLKLEQARPSRAAPPAEGD